MAKFSGYYDLGGDLGGYLIDSTCDYANRAAAIVDTVMRAALSLLNKADIQMKSAASGDGVRRAIKYAQQATGLEYRLWLWKTYGSGPEGMARSWADDAFCTVKKRNTFDHKNARLLADVYDSDLYYPGINKY